MLGVYSTGRGGDPGAVAMEGPPRVLSVLCGGGEATRVRAPKKLHPVPPGTSPSDRAPLRARSGGRAVSLREAEGRSRPASQKA